MTAKNAIAQANDMRLNTMPDDQKAALLRELDGELLEMFAGDWKPPRPPAEEEPVEPVEEVPPWPVTNTWPEEDPVLLLPFPHDGVYVKYLCAKIDAYNMESDLQQIDTVEYNAVMAAARAWWRRNHRPWRNFNWRV